MFTKNTIKHIVESQRERLLKTDVGLPRLIPGYKEVSSFAQIVTGIRRCGKSTWLQQQYKRLNKPAIFLNFEDPRLVGFEIQDFNRLHELMKEMNSNIYFFDEIQNVPNWENYIRFCLDDGYNVYITGSNASVLSRELGTKLTGRHISKELFPFSYTEFMSYRKFIPGTQATMDYLKTGGFPEYIKSENPDILMHTFNDIIIRDIAVRHNIKNTQILLQLGEWLISNTGALFTANSLRKSLGIQSSSTISEYLSYFVDTYLFFFVAKFSYSLKVQSVNPKKIYCIDNGMIHINSRSFTENKGRMLENLVFLHLRRNVKEVFYFSEKHECDFVVKQQKNQINLIQVCCKLDSDNTKREIEGLQEAMDFFKAKEGVIITIDQKDEFTIHDKIISVLPFHEWVEYN